MEGGGGTPRFDAAFLLSPVGWPCLLTPLIPVAVALDIAGAAAGLVFATAALGIIPTAALMGRATEELAARSGPGVGGLLNVNFGNAPELIIALFALSKGLHEVVKASIVGSILGNILLGSGAAMFFGGLGRERKKIQQDRCQLADDDAAARRRGAADAGDLRAGRGQGPAPAGRPGGGLRLDRRAPLAGCRDRPDRDLRRRPVLLAEDPSRPLQSRVRARGQLGLVGAHLGDRAGDRRGAGRGDVRGPRRLDFSPGYWTSFGGCAP